MMKILFNTLAALALASSLWVLTGCDGGPVTEANGAQVLEGRGGFFGRGVVVRGGHMLVAASARDEVTMYSRAGSGWVRDVTLRSPRPHAEAMFGLANAMDIRGGVLVLGAPGTLNHRGAVFVYERAGLSWGSPLRLDPPPSPEPWRDEGFGNAVALGEEGSLFVGHPGRDLIYVYRKQGGVWTIVEIVTPPEYPGVLYMSFGGWIATAGDRLFVGAPGAMLTPSAPEYDPRAYSFGALLSYERRSDGSWAHKATVHGRQRPDRKGYLGSPLYLRDDLVVAGSSSEVHLYDAATLTPKAVLPHLDPQNGGYVGSSVAVGEGWIAAGMELRNKGRGGVLVFRPDMSGTWGLSHIVEREAKKSGEFFGWAIAADGPNIVVGAPGIGPGRREDGRVFVYRGDGR